MTALLLHQTSLTATFFATASHLKHSDPTPLRVFGMLDRSLIRDTCQVSAKQPNVTAIGLVVLLKTREGGSPVMGVG